MKKLLMICYYFPPIGAIASQRPAKFAKYLPEFGWEPVVITRSGDSGYHEDKSFLSDVKNVRVLRVLPSSNFTRIAYLARLRKLFAVPDTSYDVVLSAIPRLLKVIETENPDLIWISAVPTSMSWLVIALKKITGRNLVVDFHNEWTKYMYYKPLTILHDKLNYVAEEAVISASDAVITLNPWHTADLKQRFLTDKIFTIENGYDPADFPESNSPRNKKLTLTYSGALYGYQRIYPFLSLLDEIGADVKVNLLGDTFGEFTGQKYNFEINYDRNVPHSEIWKYYAESDAFFLVLEEGAKRQLPAKLYEYVQTGRPVLAMVPQESVAAEFIRANKCGFIIKTKEDLKEALKKVSDRNRIDKTGIERYSRQNLTAKLAQVLDNIVPARLSIRKFPYPYKCALSISSDMDECTPSRYIELKKIFAGLPVSYHFFVFNNNPYFNDQLCLIKNPEIIDQLGNTLHSYGDYNYKSGFKREYAVRTKEIFDRSGTKVRVWVNHGDRKNTQNLIRGDGDLLSSPSYHADILKSMGLRFVWNYELTRIPGQDRRSIIHDIMPPFVLQKLGLQPDNRLCSPVTLRDGTRVYSFVRYGDWTRATADFLDQNLNYRTLGKLRATRGFMIVYVHLGRGKPDIKINKILKNDGIWVDYTDRILTYRVVQMGLRYKSYFKGKELVIEVGEVADPVLGNFIPERDDLKMLSFYYHGNPTVKVIQKGEVLPIMYNPPDNTGKRSFTIL